MSSRTHAPETNIASDSDEDPPQLSEHALTALQEFYAEQLAREQLLEATLQTGGGAGGGAGAGPVPIEEDWQLSQFWYDDITAQALAEEALQASHNRIACISCPTLYSKLLELKPKETKVILLEYDRRFEVYGEDFVFYDYNKPLDIPNSLSKHSFDLVVADPPFLAEECLQKIAETVRHLARDRILLCTGAVMEELAFQLLGVRPCTFVPRHTRNLANEFRCYTNYTQTTLNPAPSTQC